MNTKPRYYLEGKLSNSKSTEWRPVVLNEGLYMSLDEATEKHDFYTNFLNEDLKLNKRFGSGWYGWDGEFRIVEVTERLIEPDSPELLNQKDKVSKELAEAAVNYCVQIYQEYEPQEVEKFAPQPVREAWKVGKSIIEESNKDKLKNFEL